MNVTGKRINILTQRDSRHGLLFATPLVSFKRDKNLQNLLVGSALRPTSEPSTFKCPRKQCKTCPFIVSLTQITGPTYTVAVSDYFVCTSTNLIYCITCSVCFKLYIGETGRKLGDRFVEHLRDVQANDLSLSKPVARHFNLPGYSFRNMQISGITLHNGSNDSRKRKEQKLIFKLGTLAPNGINERFSFI